ncbi:MAG: NAD(P)/FAD-dependent oxidoreductase [Desulfobacteraceae bacterium]|jgi:flavin-dependent dehydrogenase
MINRKYDVVVVGAGPGGSVAAKKCAQNGFRTLLLEKRRLPREKVCTGMIMGVWAHSIVEQQFGDVPGRVLVEPHYLSGHMLHLPDMQPQVIEWKTPITWRRDLDFWMNKRAKEEGVEIWDRARFLGLTQTEKQCRVTVKKDREEQELSTRFVIGADGAASAVRKSLFPSLKVHYSTAIRECYEGSIDIERDCFHWFFPKSTPHTRFDIIHKGDFFLIEGGGLGVLREEINQTLTNLGFDPSTKPVWKDGCLVPRFYKALITGAFCPASGNVLLIGDAANLIFPITYEGIGPALKSGLLAADSISEAAERGTEAGDIYLRELGSVLDVFKGLYSLSKVLEQKADEGVQPLARAMKDAYEETLKIG